MSRPYASRQYKFIGSQLAHRVRREERQRGRGVIAFPKPEPRKRTKARKDRQDAKQLRAFRQIVWAREKAKSGEGLIAGACCQSCGTAVFDWCEPRGEVHHRIGRRDKTHRYDPDNGVLLCGIFGNDCHGKATRHEIEV